jgi:hypothetical protein
MPPHAGPFDVFPRSSSQIPVLDIPGLKRGVNEKTRRKFGLSGIGRAFLEASIVAANPERH